MSASPVPSDTPTEALEMGRALLRISKDIGSFIVEHSSECKDQDFGFIKTFADVVAAIGTLFKESAESKELIDYLEPLACYTTLMPYFLLIKDIVERVKQVMQVDWPEHQERLTIINCGLIRIAAQATVIAKRLEDLGDSLIKIVQGDATQKEGNLMAFDIHYQRVSSGLASCITDMQSVKCQIDRGFQSVAGFQERIKLFFSVGIFGTAASLIASALANSPLLLGLGAAFGLVVGGLAAGPLRNTWKEAASVKERYEEQEHNWKALNENLQTMKNELEFVVKKRKAV